ncbi:hypothetical protein [Pararhodospirillum photometricum]|nr:hypothetical protein [Pararhodospirillum photometricum]
MVQAVKALVAIMGLFIVGGLGLLGYGLVHDWHRPAKESASGVPAPEPGLAPAAPAPVSAAPPATPWPGPATQPAAPGQIAGSWSGLVASPAAPSTAPLPGPAGAFGTVVLTEPVETELRSYEVSGTRLVVEVGIGDGPSRLVIVDLATGAVLGRVVVGGGG